MIFPLEKQVVSLESAKRLKELGFPQESLFCYTPYYNDSNGKKYGLHLVYCEDDGGTGTPYSFKIDQSFSAYTTAELLELLPDDTELTRRQHQYYICNSEIGNGEQWIHCRQDHLNGVESCAKMLIYLAENKLINPKGFEEKNR